LSSPLLGATEVASGQGMTVTAYVSGGTLPYRYGIAVGESSQVEYTELVGADGWIVTEVVAPEVSGEQTVVLKIGVRDAAGRAIVTDRELQVRAPGEDG
jgi:hypothetical protein